MLETERLIIKRITPEDLPWLIEMRTPDAVNRYLGGPEMQNAKALTKRLPFYLECHEKYGYGFCTMTLKESGGAPVTFTSQIDALDGFVVNNLSGIKVSVPANGELKLNPRWCSSTSSKHTAQHTFSGTDSNGNAINLQTPVVNLMANGSK